MTREGEEERERKREEKERNEKGGKRTENRRGRRREKSLHQIICQEETSPPGMTHESFNY